MIKLHVSVNKKIPLVGVEFSSNSVAAGVETEVADAELPAIRQQLDDLFRLVNEAVDAQLANATTPVVGGNGNGHCAATRRTAAADNGKGNGNGHRNGRGFRAATASQRHVLTTIAAERGIDLSEALREFGVGSIAELSVGDASALIDQLKAQRRTRSRQ